MPRSSIIPDPTKNANEALRREQHKSISSSLEKAIYRLNNPYYVLNNDRLRHVISKCISFPKNNSNNSGRGNNGKPHDVESRIALTLYHQWKREAIADRNTKGDSTNKNQHVPSNDSVITINSDLGLSRDVTSPRQLANLIGPLLEEDFRNNPQWNMSPDVRSQASGIISMISLERSQMLRLAGRLPCPHCIQWCKGEKGLWWHQQQFHEVEHSSATAVAQATSINSGAMVLYMGPNIDLSTTDASFTKNAIQPDDDSINNPMEYVRQGNLNGLRRAIENHGYRPSTCFDAKGATPLMWAAGGGHLEMTRYLIEDCNCDPCQSQRGKRSFGGRTALHWAARNGHLDVVQYLLTLTTSHYRGDNCANDRESKIRPIPIDKLIEAKTQDGTTAFGWACWQRHLQVMKCLYRHGCDIHALNSYGCSPVLWCSQGSNGNGLEALKWLRDKGCNMKLVNHNGHGVLHKAAQRGQRNVAEWLIREECDSLVAEPTVTPTDLDLDSAKRDNLLALVGPDIEGYCPSDLAGMEGHDDFAEWLVNIEIRVCRTLDSIPPFQIPAGFSSDCVYFRDSSSTSHVWERYGGLRRIRSAVKGSDL